MRVAVIQHRLRASVNENSQALASAAARAAEDGAALIALPWVAGSHDGAVREQVVAEARELGFAGRLLLHPGLAPGRWELLRAADVPTGPVALMCGDACFDTSAWRAIARERPVAAVLMPLSENELQAEAALEVAIGLSDALCGLVLVSECAGAGIGEPGHGGSAIVEWGEVVIEALSDDDELLVAEVGTPGAQAGPAAEFPQVPTILQQRLIVHAGGKPTTPYPADLS